MMPHSLRVAVAVAAFAFLPIGATPLAVEPTLDATFGSGGFVRTNIQPGYSDTPYALLVQPDGNILTAGISDGPAGWFIGLTRHLSNGTPDGTFGVGGIVGVHHVLRDHANAIALQGDGKIVAVGMQATSNASSAQIPSVYRFNADGSIDSLFATNGAFAARWEPISSGEMSAVTVLPDGRILTVGRCSANANGGHHGIGLRRFLTDGSGDPTFGVNGTVLHTVIAPPGLLFRKPAVEFTEDFGALIATNVFRNGRVEFGVVHVDNQGNVVPIGGAGLLLPGIEVDNFDLSLERFDDGRFIVGATAPRPGAPAYTNLTAFKFHANGVVDSLWGANGAASFALSISPDVCHAMAVTPDGKILLAGKAGTGNAGLVRLNSDGTPDASFGTNGVLVIDVSQFSGSGWLTALKFDNQRRLLAAGYDFTVGSGDFAVARFAASPTAVTEKAPSLPQVTLTTSPNPAGASVVFSFQLPEASQAHLDIFDASGRRVATLSESSMRAGRQEMLWDGRTTDGRATPSGVYFARLAARGVTGVVHRGSTKVIRLR